MLKIVCLKFDVIRYLKITHTVHVTWRQHEANWCKNNVNADWKVHVSNVSAIGYDTCSNHIYWRLTMNHTYPPLIGRIIQFGRLRSWMQDNISHTNFLNPSALLTTTFNIKKLYMVHTLRLCVVYGPQNKQQLWPYTTWTDWTDTTEVESVYCVVSTESYNTDRVLFKGLVFLLLESFLIIGVDSSVSNASEFQQHCSVYDLTVQMHSNSLE
jgi:hypothetical protein